MPAVTVIVCTRNRPQQLIRCLESIIQLQYPDLELIVVDNGSEHFRVPNLNYPCRTRIFEHPVPGLSRARNSVLSRAEGKIIALLDDDAVADKNWLSAAVGHFDDPLVACVKGKILPLELKTQWQQKQIVEGSVSVSDTARSFNSFNFDPLSSAPGSGSNIFLRKEAIRATGFPELFGPGTPVFAGDEHYLFHQIIRTGWHIYYEPAAIVYHEYVGSEDQYRERMYRCMVSRGALLTSFALMESGYRVHTFRHLLKKLFGKTTPGLKVPKLLKIRAMLWGPFALMASRFRHVPKKETTLLAEFGTESADYQLP